MEQITFRQLACFLAVAEELNFSRAGRRLHLSQPPLTRHIQAIERTLGTQLFVRGAHGVRLTTAGEALLPEAKAAIARIENAVDTAKRAARGQTGTLRVAYECHALYSVVPSSIQRFRKRFPDVHVTVEESSAAEQVLALAKGELDAGFLTPPAAVSRSSSDIRQERLATLPCIVALAKNHPLAQSEPLTLEQLRNETFVLHSRGSHDVLTTRFLAACHQADFAPNVATSSRSLEVVLGFVGTGAGVAILSDSAQHFTHRNVTYRSLQRSPSLHLSFDFMWRVNASSDCILHYLGIVRSIVAALTRKRIQSHPELANWLQRNCGA